MAKKAQGRVRSGFMEQSECHCEGTCTCLPDQQPPKKDPYASYKNRTRKSRWNLAANKFIKHGDRRPFLAVELTDRVSEEYYNENPSERPDDLDEILAEERKQAEEEERKMIYEQKRKAERETFRAAEAARPKVDYTLSKNRTRMFASALNDPYSGAGGGANAQHLVIDDDKYVSIEYYNEHPDQRPRDFEKLVEDKRKYLESRKEVQHWKALQTYLRESSAASSYDSAASSSSYAAAYDSSLYDPAPPEEEEEEDEKYRPARASHRDINLSALEWDGK